MSELKPCPFCGEKAKLRGSVIDGFRVECFGSCYASTQRYLTKVEAINAWNTRAAMEFDNWFYLPKPKDPIAEIDKIVNTWDGLKLKTSVYYKVQEQTAINWAKELDEHIIKRICEVWNTQSDYSTQKDNELRVDRHEAEQTCRNVCKEWSKKNCAHAETSFCCSECGAHYIDCESYYAGLADAEEKPIRTNFCPNCGAKVVS